MASLSEVTAGFAAMKSLGDFVSRDAELVLGLVGPVGTEMDKFVDKVKTALKPYSYRGRVIRLSDLAAKLSRSQPLLDEAEFDRRIRLMDAGDALRARLPEVLALAAAHTISEERSRGSRDAREERLTGTPPSVVRHPIRRARCADGGSSREVGREIDEESLKRRGRW